MAESSYTCISSIAGCDAIISANNTSTYQPQGFSCSFDGVSIVSSSWDPGQLIAPKTTCPECKGKKIYVGLNKSEPCKKCEGKGEI